MGLSTAAYPTPSDLFITITCVNITFQVFHYTDKYTWHQGKSYNIYSQEVHQKLCKYPFLYYVLICYVQQHLTLLHSATLGTAKD